MKTDVVVAHNSTGTATNRQYSHELSKKKMKEKCSNQQIAIKSSKFLPEEIINFFSKIAESGVGGGGPANNDVFRERQKENSLHQNIFVYVVYVSMYVLKIGEYESDSTDLCKTSLSL